MFKLNGQRKKYPPILPGTKEWPVVQLAKIRRNGVTTAHQETNPMTFLLTQIGFMKTKGGTEWVIGWENNCGV
jgi:hypothetical protein